jgi:D-alanyl-lipoteichoic acid acyltransferase DltB (MBOAT superfamily)
MVDNIWLSRTPADFWRRWSWPVHTWLNRYVYTPWGGRARAGLAVMMSFLVSGLAHEVMAGVGLGRVTGHQTAFFLISGLGVLASASLEKLARWGVAGEILMRLATIVFILASGTLMFTTLDYFVPLVAQKTLFE